MDDASADEVVRVLAREGTAHLEAKRSQFDAVARAVASAEALSGFLAEVRRRYPKSRHVVYGWVGPAGSDLARSSDDGEPHGTGGVPCLGALGRAQVSGAAVAVARVFGGVLLGAANLGRAYGDAAQNAVRDAGIRTLVPTVTLDVRAPFEVVGRIESLLAASGAETTIRYDVADQVRGTGAVAILTATVPLGMEERIRREALERTQGRANVERASGIEWR